MKPPAFDYVRAESLEHALDTLGRYGDECRILAGGQSLIGQLNKRVLTPGVLLDINGLTQLRRVDDHGDTVVVGALTRHRDLEMRQAQRRDLPLFRRVASLIGHPQIRYRGTVGGSLCHSQEVAEWSVLCCLLEATITLRSATGRRTLTADEFFRSRFVTARAADELLEQVTIPTMDSMTGWFFDEVGHSHGATFIAVGVTGRLDNEGRLASLRVAAGGISEVPVESVISTSMIGESLTPEAVEDARARCLSEFRDRGHDDGPTSLDYRARAASNLVARGLLAIAAPPASATEGGDR